MDRPCRDASFTEIVETPRQVLTRTLAGRASHELYPMNGAWRPFEHGPRNCVARSLVMTELRVVLACVVRQFDFEPAYVSGLS